MDSDDYNKKLSMQDIAQLSGVSIATVSRILNKNGRYSKQTEDKVMKVVEKYNYQINQSAKSLRTSKSNSIGVIVPDITNEFFANIVRSIENYIVPKGYTVFVCDSNENTQMEDMHLSSLFSKNVDGIIYISSKADINSIHLQQDIPVVYIDRRPKNAGTLVISDNEMGGYLATEHLIKNGCKNIVMLRDENDISTVTHRLSGYIKALTKYDIPIKSQLIVSSKVDYKLSRKAIRQLHDNNIQFDGVFANNDMMAIATMHELRERNIKVPQDVQVVGFDGSTLSEICDPPLTTVVQDYDNIGKKSVELIINNMASYNYTKQDYIIPVELKVRKSTK